MFDHDDVMNAIHERLEVIVRWRSKDDGGSIQSRRCAPMDFGPSRRAKDPSPRYHFWDFESDSPRNHVLSLPASQIEDIEVLSTHFEPSDFVSWNVSASPWFVERATWGQFN